MAVKKPVIQVLSGEDYDLIQSQLTQIENLPSVYDRAEECGVDCEEYRKMHEQSAARLKQILTVWFPRGRPR